MADDDSRISRFLGALGKPFKRKQSPTPTMPLWTSGIQEPVNGAGYYYTCVVCCKYRMFDS